jgi:hypothetical protein
MYIDPFTCECGYKAYAGDREGATFRIERGIPKVHFVCRCGREHDLANNQQTIDQLALSSNVYAAMFGLSNASQEEEIVTRVAAPFVVHYNPPFEMLGFVGHEVLTKGYSPVMDSDRSMLGGVVLSEDPHVLTSEEGVSLIYRAVGLRNTGKLAVWHVLFYGGLIARKQEAYKFAVIEFAVAFEAYLNQLLETTLSAKYGAAVTKMLLNKTNKLERRFTELLELAIGHKHSERDDIYGAWQRDVQGKRNDVAHGIPTVVSAQDAYRAQYVSYSAIRWLADLLAHGKLSKTQNHTAHNSGS